MDDATVAEEWRPIAGHELYDVSSLGRIRSWNRRGLRRDEPRPIALRWDSKGYARVYVGAKTERFVHQLVLETFVADRPLGFEGRHLNGVRSDNRPENLEWATHAVNMRDQYKHGTRARGSRHGRRKLTEEQAIKVLGSDEPGSVLAERLGVSRSAISSIRMRQTWVHIADSVSRVGYARGERSGAAKLTENVVREIRRRASEGEPIASLARAFPVSPSGIRKIVRRTTWTHVA